MAYLEEEVTKTKEKVGMIQNIVEKISDGNFSEKKTDFYNHRHFQVLYLTLLWCAKLEVICRLDKKFLVQLKWAEIIL